MTPTDPRPTCSHDGTEGVYHPPTCPVGQWEARHPILLQARIEALDARVDALERMTHRHNCVPGKSVDNRYPYIVQPAPMSHAHEGERCCGLCGEQMTWMCPGPPWAILGHPNLGTHAYCTICGRRRPMIEPVGS